MVNIIEIILPVFGLIGLGYFFGKKGYISDQGIADITTFIFYLAIPALLFRTAAQGVLATDLETRILIAYYSSGLFVFFLGYFLFGRLFKLEAQERAVMGMGNSFSNIVLIGLPVVQSAFGAEGLVVLMTILVFNAVILFTLPSVVIELKREAAANIPALLKSALNAIFKNPIVLGLMGGAAYGFTGWDLPVPADRFFELLGSAAGPCALFVVGATLAGFSLAGNIAQSVTMCLCKLLIMPACFFVLAHYVFNLSALWIAVGTVIAGLPTGANVFILAKRYDVYVRRASTHVFISTVFAVITLSVMLALFIEGSPS